MCGIFDQRVYPDFPEEFVEWSELVPRVGFGGPSLHSSKGSCVSEASPARGISPILASYFAICSLRHLIFIQTLFDESLRKKLTLLLPLITPRPIEDQFCKQDRG